VSTSKGPGKAAYTANIALIASKLGDLTHMAVLRRVLDSRGGVLSGVLDWVH
jgi:hypothetical protein